MPQRRRYVGVLPCRIRKRDKRGLSATAGNRGFCCRCGRGNGRGMPLRRTVAGVARKMPFRNGRESREMLPLW